MFRKGSLKSMATSVSQGPEPYCISGKVRAEKYKEDGDVHCNKKQFRHAIELYTKGIEENCDDEELNATLYTNRAKAHFCSGHYRDALNDATKAMKFNALCIDAIVTGASACVELHDYAETMAWCDKGLAIDQTNKRLMDLKKSSFENQTSSSRSDVQTKRLKEIEELELHLTYCRESEDKAGEFNTCEKLGQVYRGVGNFKQALKYASQSLAIAKEHMDRAAQGRAHYNLGSAHYDRGDFKEALKCYQLSLCIAEKEDASDAEGKACGGLGDAHRHLGDFKISLEYYQRHLDISKKSGNRAEEGRAYSGLGNGYYSLQMFKEALECHKKSLELGIEVGDKVGEGHSLNGLGNDYFSLQDFQEAIKHHLRYLDVCKELGDKAGEGRAQGNLAGSYFSLGDSRNALRLYKQRLRIAEEVGDRIGVAQTLGNLGVVCSKLGDIKQALEYFSVSLQIAKQAGDKHEEAFLYSNIGSAYFKLGDLKQALKYYTLDLDLAKELGDKCGQGRAYTGLGCCFYTLGDVQEALKNHRRSLDISREVNDRIGEGRGYGNLGAVYKLTGDLKKALECYKKSLDIAIDTGDRTGEGNAYGNLGLAYGSIGDYKTAIEFNRQSLNVSKETGDKAGIENSYEKLANWFDGLGDFEQAKELKMQVLTISKQTGHRSLEAGAYCNLAYSFIREGDFKRATEYLEKSMGIMKELGEKQGEGYVLGNLGLAYGMLGDIECAIKYYNQMIYVSKELQDRVGEAVGYSSLGHIYNCLGQFEEAVKYHKLTAAIAREVEDVPLEGTAYYNQACALQGLGQLDDALSYYKISIQRWNEVRSLLQQNDEWKISLRNKFQDVHTRLWTLLVKQEKIGEALCAVEQGRAQALEDLLISQYGFKANQCRRPEVSLSEMQKSISSSVVYFAVHSNEVYIWLLRNEQSVNFYKSTVDISYLQNNSVSGLQALIDHTTAKLCTCVGSKCEDRSLEHSDISSNIAPCKEPFPLPLCETSINLTEKSKQRSTPQRGSSDPLSLLYDLFLGSIADLICGDELIIIPDGPLFKVPFATLVDSNSRYLCESFRIRLFPSLTTLQLISNCPPGHHLRNGSLIVGDPFVEEIVEKRGRRVVKRLHQLPFAREEANVIGGILNSTPLIGKDATKEEVLARISIVAIVHIAAHGNSRTGEIALAPNRSRDCKIPEKKDYLLTMAEVLNAGLRAQLVVLSCCHSGHGEINAEGVIGIARAFLGAGARSVLVSLWAIDDEATLDFMRCFYEQLVDGYSASEANRAAMKCLRESQRFNEIKYWAPFVLIGDDVTLGCD